MCMLRIWIHTLLALNLFMAPISGWRREGRTYLGCQEQVVIVEDTIYEEELKCHNVTRVRAAPLQKLKQSFLNILFSQCA